MPTPSHDPPELLKVVVNVVEAVRRILDGPEDLAHGTTA
jgi:hypothetical protein